MSVNLLEVRFGGGLHNLPASDSRPCECDLIDVRVSGQRCASNRTQGRDSVENAGREAKVRHISNVNCKAAVSASPCFNDEL
jgi:hypothetical protein